MKAERLRQLLSYDPEAGTFAWRTGPRAGMEAGTLARTGYRLLWVDGASVLAHRMAWLWVYGELPGGDIDHINGVRTDNRIANLRCVTRRVNLQNRRQSGSGKKHGTLLGAAWHSKTGKWRALIKHDGRQKSLGYFATEEQAHEAYVAAKRVLHEGCTI